MSFWDVIAGFLFRSGRGSGTPGDQKPHDTRGGETVDSITGIAEVDGQLQDNTEIDPEIQDKLKGFPGGTK